MVLNTLIRGDVADKIQIYRLVIGTTILTYRQQTSEISAIKSNNCDKTSLMPCINRVPKASIIANY